MASLKLVTYRWKSVNADVYRIDGNVAAFQGNNTQYFRPVVGDLEMPPNTGKYFYQVTSTGDNMKVGLCTADADLSAEIGKGRGTYSCYLHTGGCEMNGQEFKRIWRLLVPVCGGMFGFLYDSDLGTLQLFLNMEFQGTIITEQCGLKGKTVMPCFGVAGIEDNNHSIGTGMKSLTVGPPRVPKGFTVASGQAAAA
jgi:hypothetical protein